MMEPPPVSIILGMAKREVRTMLRTFTFCTLSHSSMSISVTGGPRPMPTLLSSTSSRP